MIEKALLIAVDDDPAILKVLARMLSGARSFTPFRTAEEFLAKAELKDCDIVFMDLNISGQDGIALTGHIKRVAPQCDVIVITGDATLSNAIAAIKAGAYDFLTKPFSMDNLLSTVDRCLEKRRISSELNILRAAQEELSAAYSQLKSTERMKQAFLSVIGHELRTPLAKIAGGISALEDTSADEAQRLLLNIVKSGAGELHKTIEELIFYAETQKETAPAVCAEMNLNALALSVREELLEKARELEITIIVRETDANAVIYGDPARVRTAIKHLVLNAILFNKRGGRVEIAVERYEEETSVAVRDTGIGIPAELLSAVGDPFYQVADYMTRKTGGIGLGLAIAKNVAETHKGGISVRNLPGEGAEFMVTFSNTDPRAVNPEPEKSGRA
ncbi:MAG: hybrid sensor histidine kinase/response regulator [Elusimicrobia bacterium]|nr:hybrid sensor histidine kinase/response regulator [Elusimicrobiota bacterium]